MLELFQPIFKGEERPSSEDANFCFLYLQSSFFSNYPQLPATDEDGNRSIRRIHSGAKTPGYLNSSA